MKKFNMKKVIHPEGFYPLWVTKCIIVEDGITMILKSEVANTHNLLRTFKPHKKQDCDQLEALGINFEDLESTYKELSSLEGCKVLAQVVKARNPNYRNVESMKLEENVES